MVLPSGGRTFSSRSPRSSSPASGVVKVAESVTGTGRFNPFSPLAQGFARYAMLAFFMGCPKALPALSLDLASMIVAMLDVGIEDLLEVVDGV